jgi:hypothetical protein
LQRVLRGDFPPLRQVNRLVAPALEAICLKAMALRPADRYESPRALAEDIEHWLADEPNSAHREGWSQRLSRWSRRHRTWTRAGAVALSLIALVSVIAAIRVDEARQGETIARRKAEASAIEAKTSANQAKMERELANRRSIESKKLSARLSLDRALDLCKQGDVRRGMLWLGRSLQIAPAEDSGLQYAIRMNLGSWGRQFRGFLGYLQHDTRTTDAVEFSPDGKILLTRGDSSTVRMWDATTAKPIGGPMRHPTFVTGMRFCPDGETLLTWDYSNKLRLWDVKTAELIRGPIPPRYQFPPFTDLTFSPDGKTVALVLGSRVSLRELATGKQIGEPMQQQDKVLGLFFSPNGRAILIHSLINTTQLWDATTAEPINDPIQHLGGAMTVTFSLIAASSRSE